MLDRTPWHDAAAMAAVAHRHQVRKDGLTPYAAHPTRVALTVAVLFGCDDPEVLAAALLHDVIEDCDVDYDDVEERFGPRVAEIVVALTKDMRLPEPRREPAYDAQLAAGPWAARLIKMADVHDNLHDAADADDGNTRSKLIERARRILALVDDDPRLARGRQVLEAAVEAAGRDAG